MTITLTGNTTPTISTIATSSHAAGRFDSHVCFRSVRNALSNSLASMFSFGRSSIASVEAAGRLRDRQLVARQLDDVAELQLGGAALIAVDADALPAAATELELRAGLADHRVLGRDRATEQLDALIRGAADRQLGAGDLRVTVLGEFRRGPGAAL